MKFIVVQCKNWEKPEHCEMHVDHELLNKSSLSDSGTKIDGKQKTIQTQKRPDIV